MRRFLFASLYLLLLNGCALNRAPVWQQAGTERVTANTASLLAAAHECMASAANGAMVDRCIELYEAVLKDNPASYRALADLASLYTLKGTAYSSSGKEKSANFATAMDRAELAMYTNAAFKAQVDAGRQPWEAADTLGAEEVEAMFMWVTALQYEFKEGMSFPSKVRNIDWMQHALVFLNRIEQVRPEYGGGAVEFAKGICYSVLPESRGGSDALAEKYMQKAVERSDGWLLPRWARGKYYYPVKGQQQAAKHIMLSELFDHFAKWPFDKGVPCRALVVRLQRGAKRLPAAHRLQQRWPCHAGNGGFQSEQSFISFPGIVVSGHFPH